MVLEVLNVALVLLGFLSGREGAEVASMTCLWILFSRIEPVFARGKFANHDEVPSASDRYPTATEDERERAEHEEDEEQDLRHTCGT